MKIIIACGGSGGHLFPGIAVADALRRVDKNCQILFVASQREMDKKILKKQGYPYVLFPPCPMPDRISFGMIPFFIKLLQILVVSFDILRKGRPNLVLGLGGFISGPVLLCAYLLRIPTVIHEQNLLPGRTSLILSKFVDAVAISFKQGDEFFKEKDKVVFTGNPIRSSLNVVDRKEAARNFGFIHDKFTLLVMGGSQGAHAINQSVVKTFEKFSADERKEIQVIHISGLKDYQMLQDRFKELGLASRVYNFLEKIDYAYCASDIVISRAGATTISEIAFFDKASVLIPYPYSRAHQLSNARYMAEHNKATVLEEDEHLVERLYDKILYFYRNKGQGKRLAVVPPPKDVAVENIVDLILNLKTDEKN